jgi:hypothetical protein
MPEIKPITSEALQATIRRLLPSQIGFGSDLEATNLITPIIDVTPTAEGSQLPVDLARASAYASATSFSAAGATVTVVNTTGFYKMIGSSTLRASNSANRDNLIQLSDGATPKTIWRHGTKSGGINGEYISTIFDFTFYLNTGDSLICVGDTGSVLAGSVRQVADVYGNIVNPAGFTFE